MTAPALFTIRIANTNLSFTAPGDVPLLQSAERAGAAGLLMDSSCRNGTCRTCLCQLLEGKVTYRIEWPGLSADEKRDGFVLPCAAYPLSDLLIDLSKP